MCSLFFVLIIMCWASLIRKPENWNTTKPKPLEYPVDRSMCSLMLQCKWTPTMKSLTTLLEGRRPIASAHVSFWRSLCKNTQNDCQDDMCSMFTPHNITCEAKTNIHCSMKIWFVCFRVVVCVHACARAQTHTHRGILILCFIVYNIITNVKTVLLKSTNYKIRKCLCFSQHCNDGNECCWENWGKCGSKMPSIQVWWKT